MTARWNLALCLLVGGALSVAESAKVTPPPRQPRVVVGLKDPLTPAVIAELKNVFGARIVNYVPGNAYALVLLRPGETLQQVQAKSKRIRWVDPEMAMGAQGEPRLVAVVVSVPSAKAAARARAKAAKAKAARAKAARARARAGKGSR